VETPIFKEDPAGQHQYLKVKPEQESHIKERFINLISTPPKNKNTED